MLQGNKKLLERASKFLRRMAEKPAWDFSKFVIDPRNRRGQRWEIKAIMSALLFGLIVNRTSLRAVERLTEWSGKWLRKLFPRRVPDTTMYNFLEGAKPEGLRQQLHAQVRSLWRSKSLEPVGLPCGIIAIDGKALWSDSEIDDPNSQRAHPQNRPSYEILRVVRSVLISSGAKTAIDQMPIPSNTNDMGVFREAFEALESSYKSLYEICSVDAGFCSEANARQIDQANKGYIMALKENQPELFREAERLLGHLQTPELSSEWESYQGERIRYRLYRSEEIAGYLEWTHLKQVWRVEKEMIDAEGKRQTENHYRLTNLHWGRLKARQILTVVRSHWGIENCCFWSLDVIWDEDSKPWCTKNYALQTLGLLRLMAYNLVALLRFRYLRKRDEKRPWQEWFDLLFLIIVSDDALCNREFADGI